VAVVAGKDHDVFVRGWRRKMGRIFSVTRIGPAPAVRDAQEQGRVQMADRLSSSETADSFALRTS